MDSVRILLTGAGAPGAAGIIHCLRQDTSLTIYSADMNPDASGKLLSDKFFLIPKASDVDFIPQVLQLCQANGVQVVMPLVTRELLLFAEAKELFLSHGIQVIVSSPESIKIANDKGALYSFLESQGVAVPNFRIVQNLGDFQQAVSELDFPEVPVCFKPCQANGSRGFRVIHPNPNELGLLFDEKPSHTFIRYAEIIRILSLGAWPELLVSEYLPGEEYSVDCLIVPGQKPLIAPRKRDRIQQGISTAGTFVNNSEIIDYCHRIIDVCQLSGNIGIQVKESKEGKPLLLEINPRVQGTISSALGAGVNFPLLAVHFALGKKISLGEIQPKWGTRFVRVWRELFYE